MLSNGKRRVKDNIDLLDLEQMGSLTVKLTGDKEA